MKLFLLCALALIAGAVAAAPSERSVAEFSALRPGAALPDEWQITTLPRIERHTRYVLAEDDGVTVLRAESDRSMSSVLRRTDVDPAQWPWLRWRWRVDTLVEKSSLAAKETDDFSARVYVLFDVDISQLPFLERARVRIARALYGGDLPLAALCYVWATSEPVGTSAWNAYTDRVRVIVVESGGERLGRWVDVERNVAEDYRAAFGTPPPRVSAVVIASDSDNTGGRALAWFGDMVFAAAQRGARR
jgi:hypothetical protein